MDPLPLAPRYNYCIMHDYFSIPYIEVEPGLSAKGDNWLLLLRVCKQVSSVIPFFVSRVYLNSKLVCCCCEWLIYLWRANKYPFKMISMILITISMLKYVLYTAAKYICDVTARIRMLVADSGYSRYGM